MKHRLLAPVIVAAIERAASAHRGRPWSAQRFTDLGARAAHPAGILHGTPFSVFAKLSHDADADREQFAAELAGLELISRLADVGTPTPVATGLVKAGTDWLLLFEALPERAGDARSPADIGRTLAALHQASAGQFGLTEFNGFFGPFPQDNRPVASGRWADFYAERRIEPLLRLAVDSGNLPTDLADGVVRLVGRLRAGQVGGDEPRPSLLHGDAQQNNFICTGHGAVVIDAAPYFGHPEIDLALIDYFEPVSPAVLAAYQEIRPIDDGFAGRRELWRVFAYLAVITASGQNAIGRQFTSRLAGALRRYAAR